MPVWSEKSSQNTQSPLVLGGKIHPAPAACSDSQWRPFMRSTGEPPHHEVQRKSLRCGGRSQAAGISQSQSASLLSSNVCALIETVSETSCPRMTSMPPKRQIPATALIYLESHGASRICWMNGAGFPVTDQHSPQLTSEFRGVWAKWKGGWMSTARPPLDKKESTPAPRRDLLVSLASFFDSAESSDASVYLRWSISSILFFFVFFAVKQRCSGTVWTHRP